MIGRSPDEYTVRDLKLPEKKNEDEVVPEGIMDLKPYPSQNIGLKKVLARGLTYNHFKELIINY